MCESKATLMLIDGPGPEEYTLSCAEHEEAMKSDTHGGSFPFTGDAFCCYIAPARSTAPYEVEVTERPLLYGDHLLSAFAVAVYAAVHRMEEPEAEKELRSRPEAHAKYGRAAEGALLVYHRMTD